MWKAIAVGIYCAAISVPAFAEDAYFGAFIVDPQYPTLAVLSGSIDIDWTAARPGWLLDEPLSGDFHVAENDLPSDSLRTRRADLAQFLIDCAMGDHWIHKTPFIARPEADSFERPTALLDEFLPH